MVISSKELERWGQKLNQQTQGGGQQSQQLKTTLEDKQTTHTGIYTQERTGNRRNNANTYKIKEAR